MATDVTWTTEIIHGLVTLAAVALGGGLSVWATRTNTAKQGEREERREKERVRREVLGERLRDQTSALAAYTEAIGRWFRAPVTPAMTPNGRVDIDEMEPDGQRAHEDGMALMTRLNAAFGDPGFAVEASLTVQMAAVFRVHPELREAMMHVAQRCIDEMQTARAKTARDLDVGVEPYLPKATIDYAKRNDPIVSLAEVILAASAKDAASRAALLKTLHEFASKAISRG